MNVLIVDDDKLARKGLVAIMDWKKYGFEVVGDVQNGRKALEFLRNHPVDIVFTDIDMPEIDGLELMQMCGEEFPEIKFVILSSSSLETSSPIMTVMIEDILSVILSRSSIAASTLSF